MKKIKNPKPRGYWTKEKVFAQARKYKTYSEWKRKCSGSCRIAQKNGWMPEIRKFVLKRLVRKPYTKKEIFKESKKYKRRVDFQEKSPYHYSKALKKGWIDECCKHMMSNKESSAFGRNFKWTKTTIFKAIKKVKTLSELYDKHKGIIDAIIRLDLMKEVHKKLPIQDKTKWTYEKLKIEALKYKNKLEFEKNQAGALRKIYNMGWLELLSHMPSFEEQKTKWTQNNIVKAIFECNNSKTTLSQKYPGAYFRVKKEPNKYSHLFVNKSHKIEKFLLHPKIVSCFVKNKINVFYEERYIFKGKIVIPDFVWIKGNNVYVMEAKTEGSYGSSFSQKEIDRQIKEQKYILSSVFKGKKIVNILVSEYGTICSKNANYNISLESLKHLLINNEFLLIPFLNKSKIEILKNINHEYDIKFKNSRLACASHPG